MAANRYITQRTRPDARPRLRVAVLAFVALSACSGKGHSPRADVGRVREQRPPPAAAPIATVEVTREMQRALQFEVETLKTVTVRGHIFGYGRVLNPQPLAAAVNEWDAARAAAIASAEELQRLKILEMQNTASLRALQRAEAVAVRDQMLVRSIRDRIELSWGGNFVRRVDLAALVQALVARDRLIIRVDLPGGEGANIEPRRARFTSLVDSQRAFEGEYLGLAPTTDPELQGRGFFFLTSSNPLGLTPGTSVDASVDLGDAAKHGVFLPESAVVRYEARTWVYRQSGPTRFVRVPVSLDAVLPGGWLVTDGLHPQDRVVIQGAQMLLSEELKPQTRLAD